MPNRAEHALTGAEGVDFVRDLPPGGGFWRGDRVQVALAESPRAEPRMPHAHSVDPAGARFVVVSSRPEQFAAALQEKAPERRIVQLAPVGFGERPDAFEVSVGDAPAILVGDPDLWQSQWGLFVTLQRGCDVVFDGCSLAEVRALTRSRDLPPPFAGGVRPLWIRTVDGLFARATLEVARETGFRPDPP
jgi:S-DNA-T family DNA segregation ATPase FtsK/SpoIIIE